MLFFDEADERKIQVRCEEQYVGLLIFYLV